MREDVEQIDEAFDKSSPSHAKAKELVSNYGNRSAMRAVYHGDGSATIHTTGDKKVSSATRVDHIHDQAGLGYNRSAEAYKNSSKSKGGLKFKTKETQGKSIYGAHEIHISHKGINEEADINELFEMQLMGTDEYRKHAIAMTPGQSQEIANAFTTTVKTDQKKTNEGSEGDCGCGGNCKCNDANGDTGNSTLRKFSEIRKDVKEAKEKDGKEDGVETEPTLVTKHKKGALKRPNQYDSTLQGLPVASRSNAYEEKKPEEKMMPTPRQVPAPPGGHPVPKGYKRVKDQVS